MQESRAVQVGGNFSPGLGKPTMRILTRSDTNEAVQPLEIVRGWKFQLKKVVVLYYPISENKGADQLRGEAFPHMQNVGFLTPGLILYCLVGSRYTMFFVWPLNC